MGSKRFIFLLSLFSLIAVACFSNNKSFSSSPSQPVKDNNVSFQLASHTSSELERVQSSPTGQVWQTQVKKKTVAGGFPEIIVYSTPVSRCNLFVNFFLLPVKAYLFQIYPSHNFW